jgi:hypothetical protein
VRLRRRRGLLTHAGVFDVAITVLVVIWLVTGRGSFWPGWPMLGWGAVLAVHACFVLLRGPITETAVDREAG